MNIYVTRCKFMINRQNTTFFTDNDIFEIQDIVLSTRLDGKPVDIGEINRLLAEGIENIMKEKTKGTVIFIQIRRRKVVLTKKQSKLKTKLNITK
ncbi:hypothetical protein DPMN_105031 [Dreissena polymorpha]|uniref:Uncharacterized protein n=1 Tax=Dreissena polymorpha TaxID=45954 RepID=A0A9D4HE42_DREPO|nr:hypothetical protein DPMN_105031 [Dreissena polymorpha]